MFPEEILVLEGMNKALIYAYLAIMVFVALFFAKRASTNFRLEIFFINYFILTGNYNDIFTFSVFGPERILLFILILFQVKRFIGYEKVSVQLDSEKTRSTPLFLGALFMVFIGIAISQLSHINELSIAEIAKDLLHVVTFILIILVIRTIGDRKILLDIGKCIIIAAACSAIVSIIQSGIDPFFMRYGDMRPAFGHVIRSNGIFRNEYFNSYLMIAAIIWSMMMYRNRKFALGITVLLALGVFSTFHRMSWLVLAILSIIYTLVIRRTSFVKLLLYALSGGLFIAIFLLFFQEDLSRSQMVRERLEDTPGGRLQYFSMVFENIDERPWFGYGTMKNDVYYKNMLRITGSMQRATAESGDVHNTYLQVLFIYGIPVFALFIVFLILTLSYFFRLVHRDAFFSVTFLFVVAYAIGSFTNNLMFSKYVAMILAIHIGIGVAIHEQLIDRVRVGDLDMPQ